MSDNGISRREFLKRMLAASALMAVPTIFTTNDLIAAPAKARRISPNDKIRLACCGIGNRGGEILNDLNNTGLVEIVALCDTDMGAPHTTRNMNRFPDAKRYQDFRKMFDEMGARIDAVSVGVPDHSHFPITMTAMSLGIHVYVEKPMARTFREVELMMNGAKKHKVVTQMGNQGHSDANYFQFKAWVDAGIIKDVYAITAHMNNSRRWHTWDPNMKSMPTGEPVPATLDWNTWTGVAAYNDYNRDYIDGQWRSWYDYGMGCLGDWGAHIIDTAHEFLDLGLPYEVDPVKLEGHNPFFYPMASTLEFKFPERGKMPPVVISWYDGADNIPKVPEGYGELALDPNIPPSPAGDIVPVALNPGKEIYSKELIFKGGSHGTTLEIIPPEKAAEMKSRLPEVPRSPSNHAKNFLLACRGEEKARSSFDISGPLSQTFCLGVIAQKTGQKVVFDRKKKVVTNSKAANDMLDWPVPRPGWDQYYKM